MANNKSFYFEGTTKNRITKSEVLSNSHGTYAALEYDDDGYLGEPGEGDDQVFIIGCVHSYSMVVTSFVRWLNEQFTEDLLVHCVEHGSDLWAWRFEKGELKDSYVLDWFDRKQMSSPLD